MASVQEIKDALHAEREATVKASEIAMTAIDTLLNMSMWVLSVLALMLAVLAIVGWWQIHRIVKLKAEHIANRKLDHYIGSDKFTTLMDQKITEAVETRWQDTVVVREIQVRQRAPADEQPFPNEPESQE